jgi:uncharacterized membrane protein
MKFTAIPKWIIYTYVTIAALGLIDATYLTINHYRNTVPPCFIGSCEQVLTSSYAAILGIPVAVFGVAYYLFILVCLVVYIESKAMPNAMQPHPHESRKNKIMTAILVATVIGFLMSLYFFGIQALVIHDFCQYCLGSALFSTLMFVMSVGVWGKLRVRL